MLKKLLAVIKRKDRAEAMLTVTESARLVVEAVQADREEAIAVARLCILRNRPNLIEPFLREGLTREQALTRLLMIPSCNCQTESRAAEYELLNPQLKNVM